MKHPLAVAALLGATSVCALFSAAEAQTFGRSHEAITGTVGPRAAQASPYAQNVMRAAGHLGLRYAATCCPASTTTAQAKKSWAAWSAKSA